MRSGPLQRPNGRPLSSPSRPIVGSHGASCPTGLPSCSATPAAGFMGERTAHELPRRQGHLTRTRLSKLKSIMPFPE